MPSLRSAIPFVERQPERAALAAAVARAGEGRGGFVRVVGAPGIGKTRLLQAAADDARDPRHARRATVRGAAGGEYERDITFGVVRALLAPLVATVGDELPPAARGLVVPVFEGTSSPAAPAPDAGAVLNALLALVRAASVDAPLVLLVDDVQWADEDSVRFLAFLARRIAELPVLLAVGIRDPDAAGEQRWRSLRGTTAGGSELRLGPLTVGGTGELAEAAFGVAVDERFVAACHEVAGGNPLLASALLRSLTEDGIAPVATAVDAVHGRHVPDLADWVGQRIEALGSDAVAVARAVAVLGDDAPLDRVERLARVDRGGAIAAGDALRGNGLFAPDRSGFVHPLVRAAVHEGLPAGARSEAHRLAARLVADDHDGLARAAGHLQQTAPGSDPWAIELLRRAGQRALAEGAVDAAIRSWRRALAEPAIGTERVELLLSLGQALACTGDPEGARLLLVAQDETDDTATRARIALQFGRATMLHGDATTIGDQLSAAIVGLGEEHPDVREQLEAFRCLLAHSTLALRDALREALHDACRRAAAGGVEHPALQAAVALEFAQQGPVEQALRFADAALAGTEPALGLGGPRSLAAVTLSLCERHREALVAYDRTIEAAARTGSRVDLAEALAGRARVRTVLGDLAAAEVDVRAGLATLPADAPSVADGCTYASLATVLLETDRIDEALEASGVVDRLAQLPIGSSSLAKGLVAVHARVLMADGQHARALALLEELAVWARNWGVRTPSWPGHAELLPLALRDAGRLDEARAAADAALVAARALGLREATAAALRVSGTVTGGALGIERLREAVWLLIGSPARLEQIRVRVELGALLRRAGQRRAAREPLLEARDIAARCGALALDRRAHEELLASGARPRRAAASGPDALTPSERRVAELAADGLDNPAIARTLVLSRKTIEMHLSHVYRKLDVAGRGELATIIGRSGSSPAATSSAAGSSASPSGSPRPAA